LKDGAGVKFNEKNDNESHLSLLPPQGDVGEKEEKESGR